MFFIAQATPVSGAQSQYGNDFRHFWIAGISIQPFFFLYVGKEIIAIFQHAVYMFYAMEYRAYARCHHLVVDTLLLNGLFDFHLCLKIFACSHHQQIEVAVVGVGNAVFGVFVLYPFACGKAPEKYQHVHIAVGGNNLLQQFELLLFIIGQMVDGGFQA